MKQYTEFRCPHGVLIAVGGTMTFGGPLPEIESCDECLHQPGRAHALDMIAVGSTSNRGD